MLGKILVLSASLTAAAFAATINPVSYDMRNGDGQASSGSFNYWDKEYTGSGSTTTDAAPLSGGLGNLTDNVIATQNWHLVEIAAGTGPYVGWRDVNGVPVITFHFAGTPTINSVLLYLDDANNYGGVLPPSSARVQIGAYDNTFPIGDQAGPDPFLATLVLPGVSGDSLTLTLNYLSGWIFMSEVDFEGTPGDGTGIPEPSSFILIAAGAVALTVFRKGF
jgi:hypothetical protein